MIEQTSDPIPQDLCDAFSSAVREYAEWTQLIAEPLVSFELRQCAISEICERVMMWPKTKKRGLPDSDFNVLYDSARAREFKEKIGRFSNYYVCANCLLELMMGAKRSLNKGRSSAAINYPVRSTSR